MKPPVILLTFADDRDVGHLEQLEAERKAVRRSLSSLEDAQYLQLESESSATVADLVDFATRFKDRLAIFHYGGHAGNDSIFLDDTAASASGLANLLATQEQLKLVFLNGCSTRGQVKQLLELGIPAVIATSVPIGDAAAKTFSQTFYEALSQKHGIRAAFELASAAVETAGGPKASIHRSGRDEIEQHEGRDVLPWGLYVHSDHTHILDWKIARKSSAQFILRGAGKKYDSDGSINKNIIEVIANAIAAYSERISDMLELAKMKNRDPRLRDLRAAVIDSFPTPIGTHLRKLLLIEKVSTERLRKMIDVYNVSTELLAYIMLAQLWDEKFIKPDLVLSQEAAGQIDHFLSLSSAERTNFDYISIIRMVGDLLFSNDIQPFLEEFGVLRKSFREESDFQKAYQFLEEMKTEIESSIGADEIESFCVQTEEHLCTVFKHLGFCVKYTLATIKSIELRKKRHESPAYRHNLVVLDRVTAAFGVLDDILDSKDFSDNESVVLLRDDENVKPFLNLSPFVIDENALNGQQNSKLFFFRGIDHDNFEYLLTDNLKDKLYIHSEQYGQVVEQIEGFTRHLLPPKTSEV